MRHLAQKRVTDVKVYELSQGKPNFGLTIGYCKCILKILPWWCCLCLCLVDGQKHTARGLPVIMMSPGGSRAWHSMTWLWKKNVYSVTARTNGSRTIAIFCNFLCSKLMFIKIQMKAHDQTDQEMPWSFYSRTRYARPQTVLWSVYKLIRLCGAWWQS